VQKEPKSLQPERLLVSKYGKNALAARAAPRAPLGELAALPRLLDGFWEGKIGKEKEGKKCQKGRRWEEGQKGGGGE